MIGSVTGGTGSRTFAGSFQSEGEVGVRHLRSMDQGQGGELGYPLVMTNIYSHGKLPLIVDLHMENCYFPYLIHKPEILGHAGMIWHDPPPSMV